MNEDFDQEINILESPIPITIEQIDIILFQMKNCVCQIIKSDGKRGSGFFCKIPFPDKENYIYALITNNHVLDKKDIEIGKTIEVNINDYKEIKEIKIDKPRKNYLSSPEELDITILEIFPKEDLIEHFLDINEDIINNNISNNLYNKTSLYVLSYPNGNKIKVAYGLSNGIIEKDINHKCSTERGSSGSPILSLETFKVVGIHKSGPNRDIYKYNKGTFIKYVLDEFYNKYSLIIKEDKQFNNKNNNNIQSNNIVKKVKKKNLSVNKIGKDEKCLKNIFAQKIPIDIKGKTTIFNNSKMPNGIINNGLCNMNSLFQCLYYIPELRDYFINNKNKFSKEKKICKAFAEIIYELKYGTKESILPPGCIMIGDIKSFFINLIDLFLNELKGKNNDLEENEKEKEIVDYTNKRNIFEITKKKVEKNIINNLFLGYYQTINKCQFNQTNIYNFKIEKYILFNLDKISYYYNNDYVTIEDCFEYNFYRTYQSKFFCSVCKEYEENIAEDIIFLAPKILVIILYRNKFNGKFIFETNIYLANFIDKDSNQKSESYKLIGVIYYNSKENSSRNHYTGCCLTDNNQYYYFNDDKIHRITKNEIFNEEPYFLFYSLN